MTANRTRNSIKLGHYYKVKDSTEEVRQGTEPKSDVIKGTGQMTVLR